MAPVDPSRGAAVQLLTEVRLHGAYANLFMPKVLRTRNLSGRDAAFAVELAYGTLRWQGWYDAIIAKCSGRDVSAIDAPMLDVLRLGCHQILNMRVPSHAAVDSSVEMARGAGSPGGAKGRSGFANAVLRKVTAHDADGWAAELGVQGDDPDSLATRWSHPVWVVRAFADALGGRRGELEALLQADNEAAQPSLVARPGLIDRDGLLGQRGVSPGRWSPIGATLEHGQPELVPAIADGSAGVQDEGSQLVALALTRAHVDTSTAHETAWLDLCAGPGGKTAILAGEAARRGVTVTAVELHEHRAGLVHDSVRRYDNVDVIVGDARQRPWGDQQFDRVLVDAPCSGLGALRRRPEARWRKTPEDVSGLSTLQRELLTAAMDAVRPGGVVAYVTCSPHLAETECVVSDVVRATGAVLEDASALLPELPDASVGAAVQMWPHLHGTDAMYLAVLRKP
jgi:16S rRNA (cytosine967-C5)-methyltransferase